MLGFTVGSSGQTSDITMTINNLVFENFSGEDVYNVIYVGENSTLNLNNSTFKNNKELEWGVVNLNDGNFTGSNLLIEENSVEGQENGIFHNNSTQGEMKIQDSLFRNNSVNGSGGAIRTELGTKLLVENTIFKENKSLGESLLDGGGAIYAVKANSVVIKGSSFENNYAKSNGGAIYSIGDDDEDDPLGTTIIDSSFKDNTSANHGGAILSKVDLLILLPTSKMLILQVIMTKTVRMLYIVMLMAMIIISISMQVRAKRLYLMNGN